MRDETRIGGQSNKFPATRWSAIVAARSADPDERKRGFETIIAAYWKPIYKYIRARWGKSNEDAKDLTQEFLSRVIEKEFLKSYDPAKARLRTFLRTCIDGFVSNQDRAARSIKRGGEVIILSLDFDAAESELRLGEPSAPGTMDEFFEKESVRSLFSLAVESLRAECQARGKVIHFRLFELYDLEDAGPDLVGAGERRLTYGQLAQEFGLAETDVTNYLAFARREFRRIALEKLQEMTATEDEFRREARSLFGVEPE